MFSVPISCNAAWYASGRAGQVISFSRWSRVGDWRESSAQARIAALFAGRRARPARERASLRWRVLALVLLRGAADLQSATIRASPDHRQHRGQVHNRIGPVGAWLADALFFLFGRPAYLLPVMLGVACWALSRGAATTSRALAAQYRGARRRFRARAGRELCAGRHCTGMPGVLPQSAGGVVGSADRRRTRSRASNLLGATLLLLAAWMAGLSIAFGVSWFTIMDRVGAADLGRRRAGLRERSFSRARSRGRARAPSQARKEARADRAEEVAPLRMPPRIEPPAPHRAEERARREGAAGAAVRSAAGQRAAAAESARRSAAARAVVFGRRRSRRCRAWWR